MARRSVEEHAAAVRALLAPLLSRPAEAVPLAEALGRCTAEEVLSPVDLPLFRNSQMDGFAVRASDARSAGAQSPVTLPLGEVIPAGPGVPAPLQPGTAVRIMTGALVPHGADAIVRVEDTTSSGGRVTLLHSPAPGEHVREAGSDVTAGGRLLAAGTLLAPRHLAALAAAGLGAVTVRSRVRVAVLTTGSELIDAGARPEPGQIFDANSIALRAACEEAGAEVVLTGRTADDPEEFRSLLGRACRSAELVLTSGGISQGDYEVVRQVLEPAGAWVGEVAMQPGGPQATAQLDGVPVLCFPGNPVSTQVSFAVFLRPLLRGAAGLPDAGPGSAVLADGFCSPAGKRQYRRGRMDENGAVHLIAGPGSHLVAALASSDVLVVAERDRTEFAAGETVPVIAL